MRIARAAVAVLVLAGPAACGTPAAAPAATTPRPSGAAVPPGFSAASVTFVSLQAGWVLGTVPCPGGRCTSLLRTRDGGGTWAPVNSPVASLSSGGQAHGVHQVRFADPDNGWIFDPDLWVTHDGGAHWSRGVLPSVEDLQTAAGVVHAAVLDPDSAAVEIETSPVGRDAWQRSPTTVPIGAGPVPDARVVLDGTAGWLIENDRTVVGGARLAGGRWYAWQPPCTAAGGPAVLAASTVTDLVAVCDEGIWTGSTVAVRAYASHDGGTTMHRTSTALPGGFSTQIASPAPGGAVVGSATADGTAVLMATFDGAASWTAVYRGRSGGSWNDVGFTSPSQGVAVESGAGGADGRLLMTFDGGHHWSPVVFRSG